MTFDKKDEKTLDNNNEIKNLKTQIKELQDIISKTENEAKEYKQLYIKSLNRIAGYQQDLMTILSAKL